MLPHDILILNENFQFKTLSKRQNTLIINMSEELNLSEAQVAIAREKFSTYGLIVFFLSTKPTFFSL